MAAGCAAPSRWRPTARYIGDKLGPYEIVAPIGAGGMGEVYKARDTRLRREVAVKTLPGEFAADTTRRQRFEAEARAASGVYLLRDGHLPQRTWQARARHLHPVTPPRYGSITRSFRVACRPGEVPFVRVVPSALGWDPPQVRPRRRSAGERGPEPIWPGGNPPPRISVGYRTRSPDRSSALRASSDRTTFRFFSVSAPVTLVALAEPHAPELALHGVARKP
jgi:hypothetical protein